MAERSTKVSLFNNTNLPLSRVREGLEHGIWTTEPPEKILPFQTARWESESNGFATGTQGYVGYTSTEGDFNFSWNNPFSGSNSYAVETPSKYHGFYTGGSGDNASVDMKIERN